jgi:hypothetical protein
MSSYDPYAMEFDSIAYKARTAYGVMKTKTLRRPLWLHPIRRVLWVHHHGPHRPTVTVPKSPPSFSVLKGMTS